MSDLEYFNKKYDYICFTDDEKLESDFWEIREMKKNDLDEVRRAREYKILPHKFIEEYDYSVWIDGYMNIRSDLDDLIKRFSKGSPMISIKHPDRDCIYDEAKACIDGKRDSEKIINHQMKKYLSENYPKNNGLIASGLLFRSHNNPQIIKLMENWWNEIIHHSRRDQLSYNYVCWKNNFNYDESDLYLWDNEFFYLEGPHKTNIYK